MIPATFVEDQRVHVSFPGGVGKVHARFVAWHPAGPLVRDEAGALIVCLGASLIMEAPAECLRCYSEGGS